jgi:hypothetical protein
MRERTKQENQSYKIAITATTGGNVRLPGTNRMVGICLGCSGTGMRNSEICELCHDRGFT